MKELEGSLASWCRQIEMEIVVIARENVADRQIDNTVCSKVDFWVELEVVKVGGEVHLDGRVSFLWVCLT